MSNYIPDEFFKNSIGRDFFHLFAGKLLGTGVTRSTYECAIDPGLVIKIEPSAGSFQNVREWENWKEYTEAKLISDWLAPCEFISACGIVLIQRRTYPIKKEALPKELPGFLTDTKADNFGHYMGRIVCHDYSQIITRANVKLKKAKWW